ncbi:MAG: PQQ-binding-like beta-propeller repeat protein [Chloroflexi bacterium]|nr:PQQ-binding-like beta-propeller repeat protein [Chloroflexota bacterium]
MTGDTPEALAYAGGRLVVADTTEVQAFNPATGRRLWSVPGGALFLTVADGVVYTGKGCQNPCGATNSYAIDLATGKVRWVHAGSGGGQPIVAGGRLFQTWGEPNSSRIYDAASGRLLGTLPADVLLANRWGVYGTRVTRPGLNCHTWVGRYTLTGRQVWQAQLGLCNAVSASLGYGTLYLTADRGGFGGRPADGWVMALNAANGQTLWARNVGSIGGITLANRLVYVLRQVAASQVLTFDADTGKPVSAMALKGYTGVVAEPFVIASGTVYIADGSRLIALRVVPPQPMPGR